MTNLVEALDAKAQLSVLHQQERGRVERMAVLKNALAVTSLNKWKDLHGGELYKPWRHEDSPLLPPESYYDPTIPVEDNFPFPFSIQETFESVLPRGFNMKEYIESRLSPVAGNAVGIEVGGPGDRVFADFDDGFFSVTLGILLNDKRSKDKKIEDVARSHSVITGNLFQPDTLARVKEKLKGQPAHLIIERMLGASKDIPQDIRALTGLVRRLYALLDSHYGGVMFLEVPLKIYDPAGFAEDPSFSIEVNTLINPNFYPGVLQLWTRMINENYGETLEVDWNGREALRIDRRFGAPEELPMLDLSRVFT